MKTIKFIPKKKYILAFMISGLFYFSSYAQDISDRLHFNVELADECSSQYEFCR